jgi:hypothetical protein
MCHEIVCRRDFGGEWGEKGFAAYHKGYDLAVGEWLKLLARLERLNEQHGVTIVLLGHAKVQAFRNPLGPDYDRYVSDVHAKTWGPSARWADAVLFGNFYTVVDREKQGKGKGVGGTDRVIYTERRDAWDAKNRYGMPEEIWLDKDRTRSWAQVWETIAPGVAAKE